MALSGALIYEVRTRSRWLRLRRTESAALGKRELAWNSRPQSLETEKQAVPSEASEAMKRFFKRGFVLMWVVFILALVLTTGIPIGCRSLPFGRATVRVTFGNLLNPHRDFENCLSVYGDRFCGLRGNLPFFLTVSNSDWIFFVTDDQKGVNWHFYDIKAKRDAVVDASRSANVGFSIGSRAPNERVMALGARAVGIEMEGFSYQKHRPATTKYHVDLEKGVIDATEIVYYHSYKDRTIIEIEHIDLKPRLNQDGKTNGVNPRL